MMQFVDPSSLYQNTFYINSKAERTKTKPTEKTIVFGNNNNNERKKECTNTSCSTISCHMCSTRPRYVIDRVVDQYHSFISLVHRLTHSSSLSSAYSTVTYLLRYRFSQSLGLFMPWNMYRQRCMHLPRQLSATDLQQQDGGIGVCCRWQQL